MKKNKLLIRQLKKAGLKEQNLQLEKFLEIVSESYDEFDALLERMNYSMELSSIEMTKLYSKLEEENFKLEEESETNKQKIETQKQIFAAISENAPIGLFITDLKFNIAYINEFALKMFDTSRDNLLGKNWVSFFKQTNNYQILSNSPSFQKNTYYEYQTDYYTKNGEKRELFFRAQLVGKQVIGIAEDITDVETLKRDLIETSEKALAANNSKSRFLANMSHEIRTPLNGIIGINDILLNEETDFEKIGKLNLIKDSGSHLLTIINDILDFSKIEAGALVLRKDDFSPIHAVKECISSLKVSAHEKNNVISFEHENIPEMLYSDKYRFQQVVINLLGNAIKFTDNGTININLSYNDKQHQLYFSIKDSGIGIPIEEQNKLFNIFSQVDSDDTRVHQGTGLGLAISKNIAELMKGSISVKSEFKKGSTFFFNVECLPSRRVNWVKKTKNDSISDIDFSQYKILIAEDNSVNQLVATSYLKRMGCKFDLAENGEETLELFNKNSYDLILMDIQMPKMSGLKATEIIRAGNKHANIPITVLTASALDSERRRAVKAGANGYLTKPIRFDDLKANLIEYLVLSKKIAA